MVKKKEKERKKKDSVMACVTQQTAKLLTLCAAEFLCQPH